MRLIDADVLLNDMQKELEKAVSDETMTEFDCKVLITSALALKDFVNRQPTAYDVDAVVEKVLQVWDKLLYMCDMEDVDKVYDFRGCIENTIRKGGVNE